MDSLTLLGLAAACCTSASYFPQVIKSWRTGKTKDISLLMYLLLAVGIILWLVYGILRRDTALIFANSVSLVATFIILFLKARVH
ncbi:MAG: SemiSWEET transporter [Elusimicrobiota bacterium]